ncbi:MAG: hypothetical protein EA397_08320 [Deltaproteobacteria bacterium]|nr:MAG: hypothetical protein EA397_08320 [Deltaproteobacteria bacterium]
MLDALKPLDLHGAALELGEHPFEVVRLLVMAGHSVEPSVPRDRIAQLRVFGGIETWWGSIELPDDDNRRRAIVRGMIEAMLQRELIGDRTTRRENLYRGLPAEDYEVAAYAVSVLIQLGGLVLTRAPSGALVSIHPDWADGARALVSRGQAPPELAGLWEG